MPGSSSREVAWGWWYRPEMLSSLLLSGIRLLVGYSLISALIAAAMVAAIASSPPASIITTVRNRGTLSTSS